MIRAFLGLELPEDVRAALAVQQFLLPLPRRVDPAMLHLTLVFLGEVDMPVLEDADAAFAAIRFPAFDLALQGFGLFGGDRPKVAWAGVVPSDNLMRLQAKVAQAARMVGIEPEHRRFTPHVTLGRFPPPSFAEAAALERAIATTDFRAGPWTLREMVLFQSRSSSEGPRYEPLARYPLS